VKTYPEMDTKIIALLRMSENPRCLYAAARIEELERARRSVKRALPYWIKRAERMEKALDRACEFLKVTIFACPPEDNWGIERKGCDWDDCDKCWKKYFMEEDSR
jgi:hypothetical protein